MVFELHGISLRVVISAVIRTGRTGRCDIAI